MVALSDVMHGALGAARSSAVSVVESGARWALHCRLAGGLPRRRSLFWIGPFTVPCALHRVATPPWETGLPGRSGSGGGWDGLLLSCDVCSPWVGRGVGVWHGVHVHVHVCDVCMMCVRDCCANRCARAGPGVGWLNIRSSLG